MSRRTHREPLAGINEFFSRNIFWVTLALLTLFGFALWLSEKQRENIAIDAEHVHAIVTRYDRSHRQLCTSERNRLQAVVNFWYGSAKARDIVATSEAATSRRWNRIAYDFSTSRISVPAIARELRGVAQEWMRQSDANVVSARGQRAYIVTQRDSFDKSCPGAPPTPQPH